MTTAATFVRRRAPLVVALVVALALVVVGLRARLRRAA